MGDQATKSGMKKRTSKICQVATPASSRYPTVMATAIRTTSRIRRSPRSMKTNAATPTKHMRTTWSGSAPSSSLRSQTAKLRAENAS